MFNLICKGENKITFNKVIVKSHDIKVMHAEKRKHFLACKCVPVIQASFRFAANTVTEKK
jgi:hypothetical protein